MEIAGLFSGFHFECKLVGSSIYQKNEKRGYINELLCIPSDVIHEYNAEAMILETVYSSFTVIFNFCRVERREPRFFEWENLLLYLVVYAVK